MGMDSGAGIAVRMVRYLVFTGRTGFGFFVDCATVLPPTYAGT